MALEWSPLNGKFGSVGTGPTSPYPVDFTEYALIEPLSTRGSNREDEAYGQKYAQGYGYAVGWR